MAYVTGTASNYIDLLDRLKTFLTTNSTLVGLGQNWTALRYSVGAATSWTLGRVAFGSTTNGTTVLDTAPGGFPTTNFAARVVGSIVIPTTGTYDFGIDGDDAVELLIDGTVAVGWYGTHTAGGDFSHHNAVPLTAGTYSFEARVVNSSGNFALSVGWKKPGDSSIAIIPSASLSGLTYDYYAYASTMPADSSGMAGLWAEKELILKAPGLSGTEEIYVGIVPYSSTVGDYFNWNMNGMVGYVSADSYGLQPYISSPSFLHLWNDAIPYWFIANGQRVIVVAKVSGVYQIAYLGKFLPYALPTQYPYPVLIAGMSGNAGYRWSSVGADHNSFQNPGIGGSRLWYVDSTWQNVYNHDAGGSSIDHMNVWPTSSSFNSFDTVRANLTSWPDGGYTLLPLIIHCNTPANNVLGELDGAFFVTGHSTSAESIITISGVDYLVMQDGFRTGRENYMALRLQ